MEQDAWRQEILLPGDLALIGRTSDHFGQISDAAE
jgi:hypothetical protein